MPALNSPPLKIPAARVVRGKNLNLGSPGESLFDSSGNQAALDPRRFAGANRRGCQIIFILSVDGPAAMRGSSNEGIAETKSKAEWWRKAAGC